MRTETLIITSQNSLTKEVTTQEVDMPVRHIDGYPEFCLENNLRIHTSKNAIGESYTLKIVRKSDNKTLLEWGE